MKLLRARKLNSLGFSHLVVPVVAVLIIGGIGSYLLTATHADSTQVNCHSGGTYSGSKEYVCNFSLPTPVISGNQETGTFYLSSSNWILCQQKSKVSYNQKAGVTNAWWGYTVSDQGTKGWVNDSYLAGGGNNGSGYTTSFGSLVAGSHAASVPLCSQTTGLQSVVSTLPTLASGTGTTAGNLQSAVNYAWSQGVDTGVAVYDMQTSKLYAAGNSTAYYGSASVMKLFVAAKLLVTGKMTGTTEATAYKMITQSDDASLEQLLPSVGGTSVVTWASQYYKIANLGTPPSSSKASCWGNTHITAQGMALFLNAIDHDSKVSGWLVNAMAHYAPIASDGTNQTFGIPSSAPTAAVKQGWGGACSSLTGGSIINSTGIVQNRYIVTILTNTNKGTANSNSYNATQAAVATKMAGMILPHGIVTLP